jgi:hypothetical protein
MKCDVQLADWRTNTLVRLDGVSQSLRERDPSALHADEGKAFSPAVLLDDLVADANQRPADFVSGHDLAAGHGREHSR